MFEFENILNKDFYFCLQRSDPMAAVYITDQQFVNLDVAQNPLQEGDYEDCIFSDTNFSGAQFYGIRFTNCRFLQCNFSLASFSGAGFRDAEFKGCKLMGVAFDKCDPFMFSASFRDCTIDNSTFYRMKLKKTRFENCSLKECDFSEADLTESNFQLSDLNGAVFDRTLLEKADFRNAMHYQINPATNRIKNARFSLQGVAGLLSGFGIKIE